MISDHPAVRFSRNSTPTGSQRTVGAHVRPEDIEESLRIGTEPSEVFEFRVVEKERGHDLMQSRELC